MDCKADITKCDACMDGYVVFELTASKITICDKCEDNCQTCVVSANGRKSCRVCKSGFYLNPGLQTCQAKRYGCTNQYNI